MRSILLISLAFLMWLLNNPYQGIWHDAQIYGLLAAHWIYPDGLANDIFFRFGSQGDFSLFTPLYGALVRVMGLDIAARLVVLLGGALWIVALFILSRSAMGDSVGCRFAVLFGSVLAFSYSPNAATFVFNENFATARSIAVPLSLLGVGLLVAKRPYWASASALLSFLLHPLLGIWSLALVVLSRLSQRGAIALIVVPTMALVILGLADLPFHRVRLISGDLLQMLELAPDVLFKSPAETRIPEYLTAMASLVLGIRVGNPNLRPIYSRLLWLALGALFLALIASYGLPVEIIVQGQAWRVFALVFPVAGVAVLDCIQRTYRLTESMPVVFGLLLSMILVNPNYLIPIVWGGCAASFLPVSRLKHFDGWAFKWRHRLIFVAITLSVFALPNVIQELNLAGGRFLEPWWVGAVWLHGLVAGAQWYLPILLAWMLGWDVSIRSIQAALCIVIGLSIMLIQHWDRRSEARKAREICYVNEACTHHPFQTYIKIGQTVYWPGNELTVWFQLHTPSYFGKVQGIGAVFSDQKYAESRRRSEFIKGLHDPSDACRDPEIDWVVLPHRLLKKVPAIEVGGAALYPCSEIMILNR